MKPIYFDALVLLLSLGASSYGLYDFYKKYISMDTESKPINSTQVSHELDHNIPTS